MQNTSEKQACTKRHYEVTAADLPLSCPPKGMRVWDAHPRVYLPIEELGHVVCPYCEAEFTLKEHE
ncbi:MAG: zinc-finger domain-containing protein [Gammaproteobacteria bacterium]|nr:zinc-finger domain-containing protein [Gammaproteobacteria bacterium]